MEDKAQTVVLSGSDPKGYTTYMARNCPAFTWVLSHVCCYAWHSQDTPCVGCSLGLKRWGEPSPQDHPSRKAVAAEINEKLTAREQRRKPEKMREPGYSTPKPKGKKVRAARLKGASAAEHKALMSRLKNLKVRGDRP